MARGEKFNDLNWRRFLIPTGVKGNGTLGWSHILSPPSRTASSDPVTGSTLPACFPRRDTRAKDYMIFSMIYNYSSQVRLPPGFLTGRAIDEEGMK